jgi:large subunit ribosomal protein L23
MNIIKRPLLTEKTLAAYKADKKVVFEVDVKTNKAQAAKILESVFGVTVLDVNVISRLGKTKLDRKSRKIRRSQDKKFMIFKISEKDEIDIFSS